MRILILIPASLLLLAGCEPDRSLGTEPTSGSRLRARYWTAPGGAEILADWYDTELEVPCIPQQPAEGSLRCLPPPGTGLGAGSIMTPAIVAQYADAACTQRVVWRGDDCALPTMYTVPEHGPCDRRWTVYLVQGELSPTAVYSRDEQTGECVFLRDPQPDGQYLHLGQAMAPSAFVALEEQSVGSGDRLRQRLYRGADGSLLPRDLWDAELETPCATAHDADGGLRCLPPSESPGFHFADDQCLTPLLTWAGEASGCEPPDHAYLRIGEIHQCTFRLRIHGLGPLAEVTPYQPSIDGTCESAIPPGAVGPFLGWTSTGELPPETFESVDSTRLMGQGRIQRLVHEDSTGFVATAQLWDSALGQSCRATLMADATWRCAPSPRGFVRRTYADPLCTAEAPSIYVQSYVSLQGCDESPVGSYAAEGLDGCEAGSRIFEVGEALDGSPLYQLNDDGSCQEALFGGQYALGPELPAASLEELTLEQR